jgi:hypothetical protein
MARATPSYADLPILAELLTNGAFYHQLARNRKISIAKKLFLLRTRAAFEYFMHPK